MNYKHFTQLYLTLFCLFCFLVQGAAAQNVSIKKDNVNVRTGPGTDYPVYMELFKGYPLNVLQKKGDWLQISDFENDKGWVFAKLVVPGNTVIVNGKDTVNMRTKPSTTATIIANVERGVVLTKLATQGKWTKVKHSKGTVGWIYKPLLWP